MGQVYYWKQGTELRQTSLSDIPQNVSNFQTLREAIETAVARDLSLSNPQYSDWEQLAMDVITSNPEISTAYDPEIMDKLRYGAHSYYRKQAIRQRLNSSTPSKFPGGNTGVAPWQIDVTTGGFSWERSPSCPYFHEEFRLPTIYRKRTGEVFFTTLGMNPDSTSEDTPENLIWEGLQRGLLVEIRKNYQQTFPVQPVLVIEKAIADMIPKDLRCRLRTFFRNNIGDCSNEQVANKWRHSNQLFYQSLQKSIGREVATARIHSDLVEVLILLRNTKLSHELESFPWKVLIGDKPWDKPWFVSLGEFANSHLDMQLNQQAMERLRLLS